MCTPTRVAIIRRTDSESVNENVEKWEASYTADGKVTVQQLWQTVFQKTKPTHSIPRYVPKRTEQISRTRRLGTDVRSSIISNSQKVETGPASRN